jgi:hypothetical protein
MTTGILFPHLRLFDTDPKQEQLRNTFYASHLSIPHLNALNMNLGTENDLAQAEEHLKKCRDCRSLKTQLAEQRLPKSQRAA